MQDPILQAFPLGFQWPTLDPFLFCVHHHDDYPAGDERMAPQASLAGRNLGQDFEPRDGWRMYHGHTVPGFPRHPHRGFETVTLAKKGWIDHSDSLGATARFGGGDVQWMTAGQGIVHSEMFPLVHREQGNPAELFQIWLNLPAEDKLVAPHFKMLWDHVIPRIGFTDPKGATTTVKVIAGALKGAIPPTPPPHSWAARPTTKVQIWTIKMQANAQWTLPAGEPGLNRLLYFFSGDSLTAGSQTLSEPTGLLLRSDADLELKNGSETTELLLLQGRPIGEKVVQHGPFVMNSAEEIRQAFADYQRTEFGGWPWDRNDPVHDRQSGRFARHADGARDTPQTKKAN